ncbi:hypothetical protein COLO4_22390 [Corchorus olitorius]|uniref:Uncharacterized protein n=1 Tax=Corchorus olitorius TaxID=93759 RepID=A0A1R3IM78_9ROSI|nr:hypothetical protein COLO4_22390 [Corchorus olitorius]
MLISSSTIVNFSINKTELTPKPYRPSLSDSSGSVD